MTNSVENAVLERKYVPRGTMIVRAGETGNSAYLIQSGMVRVFAVHDGKEIDLARLGPGQIFGEMALVFDEHRSANVEALDDSNLIIITRQTLDEKLRKSDPTIRAIVPMLVKRIVHTNNALLARHSDLKMMVDVVRNIYDIIIGTLPRVQQETFQKAVLPKLNEFLDAVKSFEDKYSEK